MDAGIQMYSVRDAAETNVKDTLRKLSDIGYKSVEFAGFFGYKAEEIRDWLGEYGLRVTSTHTQLKDLSEDYGNTVAYHKVIHNNDIIIPWTDLSTKEDTDELVRSINILQPKLADDGITLHYHNHDFEFVPNKDGIIPYDYITQTNIQLEVDTYWVYAAGLDPVALLDKYHSRMKFYHIKDGLGGYRQNANGRPLGQGTAPVSAVWTKAKEYGLYPIVESETLTPDGLTEARVCYDYLQTL
ncbi:MAG: sugar phosphate isomerase/epimerase [Oscillospiraceae bacterium]|jgi:sugar phosphate isomerase/epimerase|nr:sugar phosphate isomerase/epimerase [Oscillospiraceae bacterium]